MSKSQPAQLSYPEPFWSEIIPRALEAYLLRTVSVDTGGSLVNIPAEGPLVSVFAPHSGWIESMIIDRCFQRTGRTWPVWLTKEENRALPSILRGSRLICMDRQSPEPSLVRSIYALLRQPNGALATSIEGARFGNPQDPDDLLTLGEFKAGPVRFATRAHVPILPVIVLGSANVASRLEEQWPSHGTASAFRQIRQLMAHPQPVVVRFLPLWEEHLHDGSLRGRELRERAISHTDKLRGVFVSKIQELDPAYPVRPRSDGR